MQKINSHKLGLTLGTLLGLGHAVWSALVAFGWAQGLLDFIFSKHMLKSAVMVESFSLSHAVILVIITGFIGYVVGQVAGMIWNKFVD